MIDIADPSFDINKWWHDFLKYFKKHALNTDRREFRTCEYGVCLWTSDVYDWFWRGRKPEYWKVKDCFQQEIWDDITLLINTWRACGFLTWYPLRNRMVIEGMII